MKFYEIYHISTGNFSIWYVYVCIVERLTDWIQHEERKSERARENIWLFSSWVNIVYYRNQNQRWMSVIFMYKSHQPYHYNKIVLWIKHYKVITRMNRKYNAIKWLSFSLSSHLLLPLPLPQFQQMIIL